MNKCTECGNNLDFGTCMCFEYLNGYEERPFNPMAGEYVLLTNMYEIVNDTLWISVINKNGGRDGAIRADTNHFEKLSQYEWMINAAGYAWSKVNNKLISMHRLIMDAPDGLVVDHINHNRLDNRECNLRVCTHQQNVWNSKVRTTNTSGYTGVSWSSTNKRWVANITVNGKPIRLGQYKDIDDAIAARKSAEAKYFGEFAYKPGL